MTVSKTSNLERLWRIGFVTLVVIDVALGVFLRFRTSSKLWLDEAQSVNIAAKPLSELTHYLRLDGAPPLYYVLLHWWMGVFGQSDFAVRSLSGVISVIGLAVAYFAIRAWFESRVAQISLAILAVLPYAIYFATETRMYALVMLESTILLWVLRLHLNKPRWQTAFGLLVAGTALLYTHYWSIYLLGVLFLYAVFRFVQQRRHEAAVDWYLGAAVVGSFVLWLPWVPIFNEQRLHTGTPWSPAPTIYQLFTWFDGFTVNQSVPHVVSSLHTEITIIVFVGLALIGIFGSRMTSSSTSMTIDFLGNPRTRLVAFIVLATMAAGLLASHIDGSAYVPRYAAVIAVPMTLLVGIGVWNFNTTFRILVILGLLSAACLWTDKWGVDVQRTQAGEVAAVLAHAPTDSVVFVCPDQLGPSLLRYSNPSLTYYGYPRFTTPHIVNWYDYEEVMKARTPSENAAYAATLVTATQPVYVVRASGYGLKLTCFYFSLHLAQDLHRTRVLLVKQGTGGFYQPMNLEQLVPPRN